MADHSGHRQRMKERALNEGLEGFQPHEFLELLLYPLIPYKDTNPIAHDLLDEFGTLEAVFEAAPDDLIRVKGMTQSAAFYISLMPDMFRRYGQSKLEKKTVLDTTEKLVDYLRPFLATRTREAVYMICLDNSYALQGIKCVGSGVVNEAIAHKRLMVEEAIRRNAVSVVIAHNHPGCTKSPSRADIELTEDIGNALDGIGIQLIDHIILCPNGDYYSFKKHGGFDLLFQDDEEEEKVASKPHLYKNGEYDELYDMSELDIEYGDNYDDDDDYYDNLRRQLS